VLLLAEVPRKRLHRSQFSSLRLRLLWPEKDASQRQIARVSELPGGVEDQ